MKIRPSLALALLLLSGRLDAGIRGRLLVDGKPLAGAAVSAVPFEAPAEAARRESRGGLAPKALASAASGLDGSFLLNVPAPAPGRPESPFLVRVDGTGAVPLLLPGVYDPAEGEDVGDVALQRGGPLFGKVVSAAGAPVAGAELTLLGAPVGDASPAPQLARSGPDGTFRFEAASATGNVLLVSAKGLASRRIAALRGGAVSQPIALSAAVPLTGLVRRPDRRTPAPSVLVRLERPDLVSRWVESDEKGRFTLPDTSAEAGLLVADGGSDGFAQRQGVRASAPDATPPTIDLVPPAALEGRTLDLASRKPVPRVKLLLSTGGTFRLGRSGPDGTFRLGPLPADGYALAADEARHVPYRKGELLLHRGESRKLDVLLTLGATVSGKVADEAGRPVPGAHGSFAPPTERPLRGLLRALRPGIEKPAFRSAADGTFVATRVAPGEGLRLTVTHPEFQRTTVAGLTLPSGGTRSGLVVTLPRGLSVSGTVVDGEGKPIADAEVLLSPLGSFGIPRLGAGLGRGRGTVTEPADDRPRAVSGPDGRFTVGGLVAGDHAMRVRKAGYATEAYEPVKVSGEMGGQLVVTLGPGGAIAGSVRTKGGTGVEGYVLIARLAGRAAESLGPGDGVRSGADGSFVIDGLRAGEVYDLQVVGGAGLGPVKKGLVPPASGVEVTVTGSGRIAGRVVDARSGQPVPEFQVSWEPRGAGGRGGMMVLRAVSRGGGAAARSVLVESPDGTFVLEDVPAGTWDVVALAKGYQAGRAGSVTVEEGQTQDGVEVRLTQGTSLSGRVTDGKTGQPVAEATVSVVEPGRPAGPMAAILQGGDGGTVTDADGRYQVEGIGPGRHTVQVRHPSYTDASKTVEVKEATPATADVSLSSGGSLGGVVLSETNQPLPSAEVSLSPAGGGPGGGFGGPGGGGPGGLNASTATSDSGGRFWFDHLSPGKYTAVARVGSRSSLPVSAVLTADESRDDLVVSLAAGATIQGLVSGLSEAQRAGVAVTALAQGFTGSARTGADGTFQITGVPTGAVSLRASVGDVTAARTASKSITVADGQTEVSAEIVFQGTATLSGHVTRSGRPVAGAVVSVNARGAASGGSGQSDDTGAYRIEGLDSGTVMASAIEVSAGGGRPQTKSVTVDGDTTLDFDLPSLQLAGSVVEAGTGTPLANVNVGASRSAGQAAQAGGRGGGAATDSNGRFTISDLDPGSYDVTFRVNGYRLEKRTVVVDGSGGTPLAVELVRADGLGLKVTDGLYGVPLRGVNARVKDGAGNAVLTTFVSLDQNGEGEIPSLPPGTYQVVLGASGYASRLLANVMVPAPTVPVALTPGGSVELTPGPKTAQAGSVTFTLTDGSGQPALLGGFGGDGRVVVGSSARLLSNLAPGGYTLSGLGVARTFTVTEGGKTQVVLP